jgi:hypothetical protein
VLLAIRAAVRAAGAAQRSLAPASLQRGAAKSPFSGALGGGGPLGNRRRGAGGGRGAGRDTRAGAGQAEPGGEAHAVAAPLFEAMSSSEIFYSGRRSAVLAPISSLSDAPFVGRTSVRLCSCCSVRLPLPVPHHPPGHSLPGQPSLADSPAAPPYH